MELDPLSIALETVETKNKDIELKTALYITDKTRRIHPLSMLLNGVIDAAVNGGIKNYYHIFFNPDYIKEHAEDESRVNNLRMLIVEQVNY